MVAKAISVIPAHHHAKAVKYHNLPATQQVAALEWRQFRDQYLTDAVQGWKAQMRAWITMGYYQVGFWLPFEHIRHPIHGPQLLEQLRQVLQQTGYPVVESAQNTSTASSTSRLLDKSRGEDDGLSSALSLSSGLQCLWYESVVVGNRKVSTTTSSGDSPLSSKTKDHDILSSSFWRNHFYDFAREYIPTYTRAQLDYMIHEMESLVQEFQPAQQIAARNNSNHHDKNKNKNNIEALVRILREYIQELRDFRHVEDGRPSGRR